VELKTSEKSYSLPRKSSVHNMEGQICSLSLCKKEIGGGKEEHGKDR